MSRCFPAKISYVNDFLFVYSYIFSIIILYKYLFLNYDDVVHYKTLPAYITEILLKKGVE